MNLIKFDFCVCDCVKSKSLTVSRKKRDKEKKTRMKRSAHVTHAAIFDMNMSIYHTYDKRRMLTLTEKKIR